MKVPNISKRSGGVGIKLKAELTNRYSEIKYSGHEKRAWRWKIIWAAAAGIAGCFALFYLVDWVWNGMFVDWFTERYMTYHVERDAEGALHYIWQPAWPAVKRLLFRMILPAVAAVAGIVYFVSRTYAEGQVQKSVSATAEMIRRYMTSQRETAEVFPKEYAEVSAQMAEIRAVIQKNEQVMKDEAARKNDLITYLAHDLKTPLTSVIGYLSLLDEAADMPAEQRAKYVHVALEKAYRLEKLTNEFFEITRYNLQQVILEKERVDLFFMLMQMTDEFYPLLQAHGNEILLQVEDNMSIYGDPDKLARVFQNILKNAIAYSYENTKIEIRARATEELVKISFQNKGRTIPKQKLDSLFEKFFRLDEARTTNTGGAGLGLAIAKDIVTLHGGSIRAESENETTTFVVELPRLQEAER